MLSEMIGLDGWPLAFVVAMVCLSVGSCVAVVDTQHTKRKQAQYEWIKWAYENDVDPNDHLPGLRIKFSSEAKAEEPNDE